MAIYDFQILHIHPFGILWYNRFLQLCLHCIYWPNLKGPDLLNIHVIFCCYNHQWGKALGYS